MAFRILVSVDGSENSLRAAAYAYKLAESMQNPEITFIHVVSPLYDEKDESIRLYIPEEELIKIREARILQARQFIEERLRQIPKPADLPGELVVLAGEPARVVMEFSSQGNYDLVVVGARGLSSLQGILLGSVSQKILALAICPVTIVK